MVTEAVAPTPVTVEPEPIDIADHDMQPVEPAKEHPLHSQLVDAVSKVMGAYTDTELPPAVERLWGLVQSRSYDRIRGEITQIWSELLKFHQRKGVRLPHQVTPTFNTINSLVKKM